MVRGLITIIYIIPDIKTAGSGKGYAVVVALWGIGRFGEISREETAGSMRGRPEVVDVVGVSVRKDYG